MLFIYDSPKIPKFALKALVKFYYIFNRVSASRSFRHWHISTTIGSHHHHITTLSPFVILSLTYWGCLQSKKKKKNITKACSSCPVNISWLYCTGWKFHSTSEIHLLRWDLLMLLVDVMLLSDYQSDFPIHLFASISISKNLDTPLCCRRFFEDCD